MNERALLHLFAVMEQYKDAPYSDWPQHEAVEITQQIWDHPWTMASETIEKFALKMEVFAATSMIDVQSRIFKIAAETAWSLLESIQEIEQ